MYFFLIGNLIGVYGFIYLFIFITIIIAFFGRGQGICLMGISFELASIQKGIALVKILDWS